MAWLVERECLRRSSLHAKALPQLHLKSSRLCSLCSWRFIILSPDSVVVHREQHATLEGNILDRLPFVTVKSSGGVSCAMTATLRQRPGSPEQDYSRRLKTGPQCNPGPTNTKSARAKMATDANVHMVLSKTANCPTTLTRRPD